MFEVYFDAYHEEIRVKFEVRNGAPHSYLKGTLGLNQDTESVFNYFKLLLRRAVHLLLREKSYANQSDLHPLLHTLTEEQIVAIETKVNAIEKLDQSFGRNHFCCIPTVKNSIEDIALMMVLQHLVPLQYLFADKVYVSTDGHTKCEEKFFDEYGVLDSFVSHGGHWRMTTSGNTYINESKVSSLPVYQFRNYSESGTMHSHGFSRRDYVRSYEFRMTQMAYKDFDEVHTYFLCGDSDATPAQNPKVAGSNYVILKNIKSLTFINILKQRDPDSDYYFKNIDKLKPFMDNIVKQASENPKNVYCVYANDLTSGGSKQFAKFMVTNYGFQLPDNVRFMTSSIRSAYTYYVSATLNESVYERFEGYLESSVNRREICNRIKELIPE